MDPISKYGAGLEAEDGTEAVAIFRAQVIGPLLTRTFTDHGQLADAIRALAEQAYRPPGAEVSRRYSASTLERWYYRYRREGLTGLRPRPRSDRGHAKALAPEQRKLLCDIRRERPSASASLILRTLELDGRLPQGVLSAITLRRFYRAEGLDRRSLRASDTEPRRRWQAASIDALWHADVCHGPAMRIGGRTVPLRIHALLDDHSRYILAIRAAVTEREVEMLALLTQAMRALGKKPEALYLDNGSTYSGETLATFCARLEVGLVHAQPYDPQARGKMERFWRTLREGCLDHLGTATSLHDVQVRLLAFVGQHYHRTPHASLMGKSPAEVYETAPLDPEREVDDEALGAALTVRGRRRVRRDGTLDLGGTTFETELGFLTGRLVTVGRSLLDPTSDPWLEHEGRRYELRRVDPEENARRRKHGPNKRKGPRGLDVPFDPASAMLDALVGRKREDDR